MMFCIRLPCFPSYHFTFTSSKWKLFGSILRQSESPKNYKVSFVQSHAPWHSKSSTSSWDLYQFIASYIAQSCAMSISLLFSGNRIYLGYNNLLDFYGFKKSNIIRTSRKGNNIKTSAIKTIRNNLDFIIKFLL